MSHNDKGLLVSLAPKLFVVHSSYKKCNLRQLSKIMAQNFSDIVLKNSDNVQKNKHRM